MKVCHARVNLFAHIVKRKCTTHIYIYIQMCIFCRILASAVSELADAMRKCVYFVACSLSWDNQDGLYIHTSCLEKDVTHKARVRANTQRLTSTESRNEINVCVLLGPAKSVTRYICALFIGGVLWVGSTHIQTHTHQLTNRTQ